MLGRTQDLNEIVEEEKSSSSSQMHKRGVNLAGLGGPQKSKPDATDTFKRARSDNPMGFQ